MDRDASPTARALLALELVQGSPGMGADRMAAGLPGDHADVGNWGYWVGTASLAVEAALIVLGVTMLVANRQRSGQRLVIGRLGQFG